MSTNDSPSLHIDNSGAWLLKQTLPAPSWYSDLAIKIPMAAIEVAENLSEIKAPEKPKEINEASLKAWRDALIAWGNQPLEVPVNAKQREAIKICLDKLLEKGGFPLTADAGFDQKLNVVPGFKKLFFAVYFPKPEEAPDAKHELKIRKSGAHLLRHLVSRDGWYSDAKAIKNAYHVIAKLPEPFEAEPPEAEAKALMDEVFALSLSEGQRETLKACVKKYMDKAALVLTKDVRILVTELGLLEG